MCFILLRGSRNRDRSRIRISHPSAADSCAGNKPGTSPSRCTGSARRSPPAAESTALGGARSVVGHSMGGMLGTRFALMFPDRTERLALVNPIGLEDWKTVVPYLTVDQFFAGELQQTPESIREYGAELLRQSVETGVRRARRHSRRLDEDRVRDRRMERRPDRARSKGGHRDPTIAARRDTPGFRTPPAGRGVRPVHRCPRPLPANA